MASISYKYSNLRYLVFAVGLAYVVYNIPFIKNFSFHKEIIQNIFSSIDGLQIPLIRSLLFSAFQSFMLIFFSIAFSLSIFKITPQSWKANLLTLLLVPIILGNVSVAFIFKVLLINTQIQITNTNAKFIILFLIQTWQYGSLFIYLFWLNQQTIQQSVWNYASAVKLSHFEKIKDVILPKQRNLAFLLFIIAFVFTYYEDAKIQFIFKSSRGTNMELVNQWLSRTYHSDSLINAEFAFRSVSQSGFFVLLAALLGLFFCLAIKNKVYSFCLKYRQTIKSSFPFPQGVCNFVFICLIVWVLAPIAFIFYEQSVNFKSQLTNLSTTISLTLLAAFLSSGAAVCFGVLCRLAWQNILSGFNTKSMVFLIGVFILVLIPPSILLVLGFKWVQLIGYTSKNSIYISWILNQTLLSFPLLAAFSLATHFRVKNIAIDYLQSHRLSIVEKVSHLFFYPFRPDYLLTIILAFAMIWNEGTINNILSDIIPSFVTELNKTISGKATDYSSGMNYLLVSLFLAFGSVLIWNFILHENNKKSTKIV